MSSNPAFWSSVGFWILMIGLVGDLIVIFVPSGRTEKILATVFTVLVAIGVAVEHLADAKRFAPRNLNVEQQELLVSKLKPFAGQKVDFVVVYANEGECVHIGEQIESVLRKSGWFLNVARGGMLLGVSEIEDIAIGVDPKADQSSQLAATALAKALDAERLTVHPASDFEMKLFGPSEPVRLFIGRK
jgi:hypothetical protein